MNLKHLARRAFSTVLLSMLCVVAFAQTATGVVKDKAGEPMIGVNVLVKGTTNGTITDFDGNFTINDCPSNATLVVSYIGYLTKEVKAGQNLVVVLEEDNQTLDEVVVVGYGVQKRKDLTGSVASVKTEELAKVASANAMQAMQAKIPGMDIQQSSGEAGAGISIQLRGSRSIKASNSPLILVDGVEYGSTLDIPASEIESMDVLKDAASTAIYGTKGANGVIIITTKRGKVGKTSVNFNGYLSFNSPVGTVKPMYGTREVQRLIDAADYAEAAANGWNFAKNATASSVLGDAERNGIHLINDVVNPGLYTDWFDTILQNSVSQNYDLSVSGGSEKTNFNVAMSFMNDKGMMKNDEFNRYTGRVNVDHIINNVVKVGTSLSYAYKSNDKRNGGVYNQAQKMTTITRPYLKDGSINTKPSYFYDAHCSPLLDEVPGAYQRNIESTRFFGSAYVQLTPIKDLVIKSTFTLDRSDSRDGRYQDYESQGRFQSPSTSYISNAKSISTKYVWQNTANYLMNIGKHDFNFLIGNEIVQSVKEASTIEGDAGAEHYYKSSFYDVSKIITPNTSSSYVKSAMSSYFARVNYSFNDRYLFQASIRADGSSVLAEGNKWGYFPSVSAGWRLSEESFMSSTRNWLDNLKFRVSWGLSGNAAIDAYQTLATVNAIVPGSTDKAPMTMANPELSWETTSAFNVGFDFSVLTGRLSGSIDYYMSKTTDLLYYLTAPASSVYTSVLGNVGETKGSGLEIALNANPIRTKDFAWDINVSATMPKDEVVKLRDGITEVPDGTTILKVGEPISAFYNYEVDGCWGVGEYKDGMLTEKPYTHYGEPGTPKVVDVNGDKLINDADKKIYNRAPKAILGMTNTFTYKGFSLSMQLMARLGGYMDYGGYGLYTYDNSNWGDLDYWTPENPNAMFPSPGADKTVAEAYKSALKVVKADYVKIKDITLGYTFDKNLLNKTFINNARIYCSLKNFFSMGEVDNYDSERGGSVSFPLAKQVVVGVNLTF